MAMSVYYFVYFLSKPPYTLFIHNLISNYTNKPYLGISKRGEGGVSTCKEEMPNYA